MKIQFVDPDRLLTAPWIEFGERRIWFAFSRFQSHLRRVVVTVKGPGQKTGTGQKENREGIDWEIALVVYFEGTDEIATVDRDADLGACLARTTSRAGRAVARRIFQIVEQRHGSPRHRDTLFSTPPEVNR